MADLVMKRADSYPAMRTTLTLNGVPVDLANVVKVTALIKPALGGVVALKRVCTAQGGGNIKSATGATAGQIEWLWQQGDLIPSQLPETFNVEFELEFPATAGVNRFQTIPNGGYKTIEIVADLGAG
jgi:hypothetical protein